MLSSFKSTWGARIHN